MDKIEKDFKRHAKHCSICFWRLAIWRCWIGAAYLKITGRTHL